MVPFTGYHHRQQERQRGMVVELQYGIEGILFCQNVTREDGSKTEIGETLDFKVLGSRRKIVVLP